MVRTPIRVNRVPVVGLRTPIIMNPCKMVTPQYLDKEGLIEKFTPLIRSIYKLFCSYNGIFIQQSDYEDLYQQIIYEFLRLCGEYDPTRGVDFTGFIKFHLQNRVYHYVTKQQKHNQKEQTVKTFGEDDSLDMENNEYLIDMNTIKQLEKSEAIASLDWRAITGKKHRALIEGVLLRNKTLEELADEEGVTIKVMRLRLHFACVKLKEWNSEMEDYVKFHNISG